MTAARKGAKTTKTENGGGDGRTTAGAEDEVGVVSAPVSWLNAAVKETTNGGTDRPLGGPFEIGMDETRQLA